MVENTAKLQVLEFYRKPLAKYGEVMECNHGKPIRRLTVTKSGLTCGDHKSGSMTLNRSDSDHELRAGTPKQFLVVGIDGTETQEPITALLYPIPCADRWLCHPRRSRRPRNTITIKNLELRLGPEGLRLQRHRRPCQLRQRVDE